jgi:hypothetical protein
MGIAVGLAAGCRFRCRDTALLGLGSSHVSSQPISLMYVDGQYGYSLLRRTLHLFDGSDPWLRGQWSE